MKKTKLLSLSILSLSILNNLEAKENEQVQNKKEENIEQYDPFTGFMNAWKQMDEYFNHQIEQMHKHFFKNFSENTSFSNNIKSDKQLEITEETDNQGKWVVISIPFPSSINVQELKDDSIKTKANGNSLNGSLKYDNFNLEFQIVNGKWFIASLKYNQNQKINNKNNQSKNNEQYREFSYQSNVEESIPSVSNLANAIISVEEDKLTVKLPSAQNDWTNVKVKKVEKKSSNNSQKIESENKTEK